MAALETMWQKFLLVVNWVIDNPEDASLLSIIALIARKLVISEVARVIQMGRDEELIWTRKRVEELTGDRWNGPQPILKRVRTQYFVNYYSYLLLGTKRVYLYRGRTHMNKTWVIALVTYILSVIAVKWGIELPEGTPEAIVDAVTGIANGIMVLIPIALAYLNKTKKPEVPTNGDPERNPTDSSSAV